MTKVSSINTKITKFLAENQSLKNLSSKEILSIMTAKGEITKTEAEEYLRNSAFENGYTDEIDVIPQWQGKQTAREDALRILNETVSNAKSKLDTQDKTEGAVSKAINFLKETFNTENRKSNTENLIAQTEQELKELQECSNFEEFSIRFKNLRGVEFSPAKIENFKTKSDEMTRAQSIKTSIDQLKANLKISTVNNVSNAGFKDANKAILNTFTALGITNKDEINKILKDIESAHSEDSAIKKYGGDFRIGKNKQGEYTIYRTGKNGFPAEATMEELQIIADEMTLRLNKANAAAFGLEIPQNSTNEQLEELISEKYSKIKEEYQTSFQEAYGTGNVETLADNYIDSQKQNTAYVETALDITSMATMFLGSGILLKGANLLTKSNSILRTVSTATNIAAKATPAVIATQVTRPIELIENLTAEEPDWNSYGMSVAEGAMWMLLGCATGAIGDKARMFLGQKGLSNVAKNTGKTIDELIKMYKSGHKLPANLQRSLNLIENTAKISGTSAEFTADILATYAIQKSRGEDIGLSDYIMSANGAILGTVMHRTFANISDAEKIKIIQNSLLEHNPKMTKSELEKASQELLEIHRLAEEKQNPKVRKELTSQDVDILEREIHDATNNLLDYKIKDLQILQNLSPQEQAAFISGINKQLGMPEFLMTATGKKPACYIGLDKTIDIEKLKTKDFDIIPETHFNPDGTEVNNVIILNKKQVKDIINDNLEIYQKRLGLDENADIETIYNELTKSLGVFYKNNDLLGMTLGFERDNALIFELEQHIPNLDLDLRNNPDEFKQAIKQVLYSENSPYKDFSQEFKDGLAERIDKITHVDRTNITGWYSVDYTQSQYHTNKLIDSHKATAAKLSEINEDVIQITKEVTNSEGKKQIVFNEIGEIKARDAALRLHTEAVEAEKEIVHIMKDVGLGTWRTLKHRPKSAQSLYDKLKNTICTDPPVKFHDAIRSIKDAVGTRTILADFNYKKHPDIVKMAKTDLNKAIRMAAERQSEEYVEKVKEIIRKSVYDPDSKIKALRISNYMGKDGIPYFSEKQVASLQDYASIHGIDLHVKTQPIKIRDSGYTALQMNFETKDGYIFEWQLRGEEVNTFAECEHVPYDLREKKDVTGGREYLKELYKPIKETVENLNDTQFNQYNQYLTAHYEHLRKLELGFDSTAPKLEDYGLTDPKLKAENLELLHELAEKLKNNDISEQKAVKIYMDKIKNSNTKS